MVSFLYYLIIIIVIIAIVLIFGYPRKKSERKPNIEGIDDPDVAKAFEKATQLPPFKLLYRKIVSKLEKFDPSGKLVDIGCGSGNLIVKIAKKIPSLELVGIDISNEILELAKQRAIKESLGKKIDFKTGTVEELPFPDNSVDFIVSTLSLHHWLNPEIVFKEINRVLKEDGNFLIFDFRRDSRKIYYGFLAFITKVVAPKPLKKIKEPLGSMLASYTIKEAFDLCSVANLQNIETDPFLAWMFIHNLEIN